MRPFSSVKLSPRHSMRFTAKLASQVKNAKEIVQRQQPKLAPQHGIAQTPDAHDVAGRQPHDQVRAEPCSGQRTARRDQRRHRGPSDALRHQHAEMPARAGCGGCPPASAIRAADIRRVSRKETPCPPAWAPVPRGSRGRRSAGPIRNRPNAGRAAPRIRRSRPAVRAWSPWSSPSRTSALRACARPAPKPANDADAPTASSAAPNEGASSARYSAVTAPTRGSANGAATSAQIVRRDAHVAVGDHQQR